MTSVNQHVAAYFVELCRRTPKQPATSLQVLMAVLRGEVPQRWLTLGASYVVQELTLHLNGEVEDD